MKKVYTLLLILVCATMQLAAQSDEFWGMTAAGGPDYTGTIFSTNTDGSNLQVRYTFPSSAPGANPEKMEFTYYNGRFYGLMAGGGLNNLGVICTFDPVNGAYSRLYDFAFATGALPVGKLVLVNGKLYGSTKTGGAASLGVLFEFDPATNIYAVKKAFTGNTGSVQGSYLAGAMVEYGGKLYGATGGGGTSNKGAIFEYNPATNTYLVKRSFTDPDGTGPSGNLLLYNNKIYGTTTAGGTAAAGTIFEFDPVAGAYAVKYNMTSAGGANCSAGLTLFGSKMYGICQYGGGAGSGTLFEFDPASSAYTKMQDLTNTTGNYSASELTVYNDALFGITPQGGTNSFGTIIKYIPATNTLSKIFDFSADAGYSAQGSFALLNDKLYSTTASGGLSGRGTIFQFDPVSNVFTTRVSLFASNGSGPQGTLLYHNSKFYGLTNEGGLYGLGVLFEFNPVGNVYTKLYDFNTTVGYNPTGTLVVKDNVLYGMLDNCWVNGNRSQNYGALFSYNLTTNTFNNRTFSFSNGANPRGALIEETTGGTFLGVTFTGGANLAGALFRYDPVANTITHLRSFVAADGSLPMSIMRYNNRYFIMCSYGGANNRGSIVEYTSGVLIRRASFSNVLGGSPTGTLIPFNNKLYGYGSVDGTNGTGTIVEFDPATYALVKQHDFIANIGNTPNGTPLLYNNKFYGLTSAGGIQPYEPAGTLFEYEPVGKTIVKKADFVNTNGAKPGYTALITAPTGNTLLVNLTGISARAAGNAAVVDWQTASEKDASHFEVERSADSRRFTQIGTVAAKGQSVATINYTFTDPAPLTAVNYYRLKMVNKDGTFKYSNVVAVKMNGGALFSIFPNPAQHDIFVKTNGSGELQVHSSGGTLLLRQPVNNMIERADIRALPAGAYTVSWWKDGIKQEAGLFMKN